MINNAQEKRRFWLTANGYEALEIVARGHQKVKWVHSRPSSKHKEAYRNAMMQRYQGWTIS